MVYQGGIIWHFIGILAVFVSNCQITENKRLLTWG